MSSAADPTAAFFANLRGSGLLQAPQLQELWSWIATTKPDVQGVAREVSRRGWLSVYQIKEIFRGRARELFLDRYVLVDLLGEGGMGRVFKAQDSRLGREVAVKVIRKDRLKHPASAARFKQEIEALGKMRHPNVVEVYDADLAGETQFYVMELIDGTDLTKIVRERGPLPVAEACEYIRQAALGLHHAFENGLVHRDIKPSNIIVSRNGRVVKLVDLGLARLMEGENAEGAAEAHRITQEGFVIGTPDFLAPEQARNPMGVDIRADIYALGGTLYYILTGKVPYDGANPTEKLLKHCTEPPPGLLLQRMDAPVQVEQLIHWCMAKEPEARPQTPLQLALALQPFCPAPLPGAPASGRYPIPGAGGVAASGRHPATAAPVPVAAPPRPVPAPAPVPAPQPPYAPQPWPAAPPRYAPPAQPQPVPVPVLPLPLPAVAQADPNRSSQVFQLPPESTTEESVRRRSESKFPWSMVLLGLGALLVVGILGFGIYIQFIKKDEPPVAEFTNSQKIRMVKLDGGTFRMGSPENELGRRPEEGPAHEVTITGPLLISATEVTHEQFLKVMGKSPSKSPNFVHKPQNHPVEFVTWDEANEFCKKLTEQEKSQPWARKGWAYRLPTEAEWEYACRAKTESPFAFGDRVIYEKQAKFRPTETDLLGIGGGGEADPRFPQEVKLTEANAFELHDLHGNVWEWCSDYYKAGYPGDGARENPTGPADGDRRVIRGGSFREPATATRSASRAGLRPSDRRDDVGFRIVYAPVQK